MQTSGIVRRQVDLQGVFVDIGDFSRFKGPRHESPKEVHLRKSTPPQKIARKVDFLSLAFTMHPVCTLLRRLQAARSSTKSGGILANKSKACASFNVPLSLCLLTWPRISLHESLANFLKPVHSRLWAFMRHSLAHQISCLLHSFRNKHREKVSLSENSGDPFTTTARDCFRMLRCFALLGCKHVVFLQVSTTPRVEDPQGLPIILLHVLAWFPCPQVLGDGDTATREETRNFVCLGIAAVLLGVQEDAAAIMV